MNLMSYIQVSKSSGLRHKNGKAFYDAFDGVFKLFDVEILQLHKYALSIQNSETENNEVSRSKLQTTYPTALETSGATFQYDHYNPTTPDKLTRSGLKTSFTPTTLPFSRSGLYYSTKSDEGHHILHRPPFQNLQSQSTEHAQKQPGGAPGRINWTMLKSKLGTPDISQSSYSMMAEAHEVHCWNPHAPAPLVRSE